MENRAQKLADRFAASSVLRMAEANAREAPTQPLFHYTTEQALDAIVKSEVFWFTSIYHMDDDEELSFGFAVAHSLMKVAVARGDPHVITFLAPMVEDYGFERIKERFEFYSVSFGQRDDAQQWTKYAAEGTGVALGFATPFFGLLKDRDFKPEEKIFLGKGAYGELAAKARHAGVIYLVVPNQARACRHEELQALLPATFTGHVVRSTVPELFPTAQSCIAGRSGDTVVVTGSVYLIGEVLARIDPDRGANEGRLQDF